MIQSPKVVTLISKNGKKKSMVVFGIILTNKCVLIHESEAERKRQKHEAFKEDIFISVTFVFDLDWSFLTPYVPYSIIVP